MSYSLFDNVVFDSNQVSGSIGGSIYMINSNYSHILNSNFIHNLAQYVPSINIDLSTNIIISNSNFIGNKAISDSIGGSYSNILFSNSYNIKIVSCLIKENEAGQFGSISFNSYNINVTIDNSIIEKNAATQGVSSGYLFLFKIIIINKFLTKYLFIYLFSILFFV